MTRILVPTDFSEPSLIVVRYAVALTCAVSAEALLLHVVEEEPVRRYAVGRRPEVPSYWVDLMADALRPQIPQQVMHHDLCEEAQGKLRALLPPAWHDRFRTLVVAGKAAEEIVRVAREQKVEFIMMGGRSRRGVRCLFHRSLAKQVARRAAIPVITVWNLDHVISDQLWVSDGVLRGWPGEPRTGKRASGKTSKARRISAPLGV